MLLFSHWWLDRYSLFVVDHSRCCWPWHWWFTILTDLMIHYGEPDDRRWWWRHDDPPPPHLRFTINQLTGDDDTMIRRWSVDRYLCNVVVVTFVIALLVFIVDGILIVFDWWFDDYDDDIDWLMPHLQSPNVVIRPCWQYWWSTDDRCWYSMLVTPVFTYLHCWCWYDDDDPLLICWHWPSIYLIFGVGDISYCYSTGDICWLFWCVIGRHDWNPNR